jgi:two-component system sensor histidine kinase VicK
MQYTFEQSLVDALPVAAAIFTGSQHTIKAVNLEMLNIWAKDSSVIGKDLHDAIPEIKDQSFFALLTGIYQSGISYHDPNGEALLLVNGKLQPVYLDFCFKPIKDEEGNIIGVMNTAVNTSEKVLEQQKVLQASHKLKVANDKLKVRNKELATANAALQTAVEQLSAATAAAQLGLFDWDLIKETYSWDARFKQMFGLSADNNPKHFHVMVSRLHEDDRERVKKAVQDARNQELTGGKYDIEYRIVGAGDVPVRWARALGRVIFNKQGTPVRFIGTLMDITEQVIIRQQLQASEERLRLAIESADLGTWFMDTETGEITTSPRLKEMFGFEADEDMPSAAAVNQIVEEYREAVVKAIKAAIEHGESYDIQYPVIGFRDGRLRWVRARGKLFPFQDGQAPLFSGTMADITDQKQTEQRKNDFISMVSHELKTPLTSTISYVQLSQKKAAAIGNQSVVGMLERADKQLGKMTTLINGFLNVARLEAGEISINKKNINLAMLVKEVEESILPDVSSHHLIFDPVVEIWVDVDKDKIEQVFNNFISNAIKYSPRNSTIQIACVTKDNQAYVSVKDEGMGIRLPDQERLFDRFYRVEGQDATTIAGFGIGLYICKEIIARHEGQIGVESTLGNGSTFWFTLPLA